MNLDRDRPDNFPDHLWPSVERVLEQHLATRDTPLSSGGGVSATEAAARRCAMLSVRNVACPACRGQKGRHRGIVWHECEKCGGSGEVKTTQPKVQLQSVSCDSCRGSGEWRRQRIWIGTGAAKRQLVNRAFGSELELATCVRCGGHGYVETCDASPSQPPAPTPARQPDELGAARHSKLSAVLRRLQEADAQSMLVVEVHYGPIGVATRRRGLREHWRELALWPLTSPGASLLRYAPRSGARSPQAALARLMASQEGADHNPLVSALAEQCQRAAWLLLGRARASLMAVDDGTVARAAKRLWERAS